MTAWLGKFFASYVLPWLWAKLAALVVAGVAAIRAWFKQRRAMKDIEKKAEAYEKVVEQGENVSREDRIKAAEDVLNSGDT